MRYLTLLCFFVLTNGLAKEPDYLAVEKVLSVGKSPLYMDFIERYKDIAIKEMARTGVPASIKMAQGILESAAGTSELAINANNHFGMKMNCKDPGKKYYLKDDDYDSFGNLVESCFRVFKSPEDSWRGHSEFLRDPKKEYRYGWLFTDLDMMDYRAWAHGLKKSGYATNPKYPKLLIKIIEEYQLDELDRMRPADVAVVTTAPKPKKPIRLPGRDKTPMPVKSELVKTEVLMINDLRTVLAQKQESLDDISRRTGVPSSKLLKYNDGVSNTREPLDAGNQIFLQQKRNRYKGSSRYHYVQDGETIEEISQRYGIKVDKLRKRNDLKKGFPLIKGQKLKLRGWNLFGDSFWDLFKKKDDDAKVDISDTDEHWMIDENDAIAVFDENLLFDEPTYELAAKGGEPIEMIERPKPKPEEVQTAVNPNPKFYVVQPGDSLYKISKKFGITVQELKAWNKMDGNIVFLGQKLIVQNTSK